MLQLGPIFNSNRLDGTDTLEDLGSSAVGCRCRGACWGGELCLHGDLESTAHSRTLKSNQGGVYLDVGRVDNPDAITIKHNTFVLINNITYSQQVWKVGIVIYPGQSQLVTDDLTCSLDQ
jgi:hypothetical protein